MNKQIINSNHYILNNDYQKKQLNINEFGYSHHKILQYKLKKFINTNTISKYSSVKENNEQELKQKIIKYLIHNELVVDNKLNTDNIVLSNSGDVNILSIYRLFKNNSSKSIIFTPTYGQYFNIGYIEYNNIIEIMMDFKPTITLRYLKMIVKHNNINFDNSICFICNPNNPTGTIWKLESLLYLFKNYPNTVFIIDETYIDFSKLTNNKIQSVAKFVNTYNNLIVMRSFSKAFGLAGLRLSYLVSNSIIIQNISKLISHKDVIELSKYAGIQILDNIKFYKKQINKMFNDKQQLITFCNNFNIKYLDSKTNFICIYIGDNVNKIVNIFKKYNILVKPFNSNLKDSLSLLYPYIRLTIQNNSVNTVISIFKKYYYLIKTNPFGNGLIDGCFDGYHYGHVMSLYNAKIKSETLLCGIHTNEEIFNHKNKNPIFNYQDRLEILKYSIFIDNLIDSVPYNTNQDIIKKYNADKFFHGSDNIQVDPLLTLDKNNLLVYYPRTKFISTTNLYDRISYYKNNLINKIKYGNKFYLNCLYSKILNYKLNNYHYYTSFRMEYTQTDYNSLPLNHSGLVIININFDLFNVKHIRFINLVKEKYPNHLIYIDLISKSNDYIIYSIDEIKIILTSIKLIDKLIITNDDFLFLQKEINNYNYIQINSSLFDNNIDNSFNNIIESLTIDNFIKDINEV